MTKDEAVALAETGWWKNRTPREIVSFQLFEPKLCMDFGDFQLALEKALGRPVFTHELGLNYEGIKKEFLGKAEPPTMQEILEMIPEAKRILVVI
jgi:hypothetical protein